MASSSQQAAVQPRRIERTAQGRAWALAAAGIGLVLASPMRAPAEDCAVRCLAGMLSIVGDPSTTERTPGELRLRGEPPYSLLSIKRAAATCGVKLEGRSCTVDEALSYETPVVLALREPDHFVLSLNQDGRNVQLLDGDRVLVLQEEEVRARFRGVALFPILRDRDGARASLRAAHHEAGTVGLGERVVHVFEIRNTGDQALQLELESWPCCGLTAAVDAAEVQPGGTGRLIMGMQISACGRTVRVVGLRTNDPHRRLLYLTMGARTPAGVSIHPERLTIVCDNLPDGRKTTALLTMFAPPDAKVTRLSADTPVVTAKVAAAGEGEGGKVYQIAVSPAVTAAPGTHCGNLLIETEFGKVTRMSVPLTLHVRPNARVNPSIVFFGFVTQGDKLAPKRVMVSTRSGVSFRILKVEASDPRITVRPVHDPGRTVHEVSVRTDRVGLVRGDVILTTDIPLEQRLRIPVHAHVLPR